ncbi:hypothetical protein MAR_034582 [Mya arenaria]|uniref:Uncharacterized protein n=1 Tax=Mya arenaria TaxID=6604 RepID=A0ABY7EQQ4_MYAAR|nr:hypothetical protein MAR_034582 [Mya arenaria]
METDKDTDDRIMSSLSVKENPSAQHSFYTEKPATGIWDHESVMELGIIMITLCLHHNTTENCCVITGANFRRFLLVRHVIGETLIAFANGFRNILCKSMLITFSLFYQILIYTQSPEVVMDKFMN